MKRKLFLTVVIFASLCLAGCKGGGGSGSAASSYSPESSSNVVSLLGNELGSELNEVLDDIEDTSQEPEVDLPPQEEPEPLVPDNNINPEPSTILMFGLSILSFLGYKIKKLRG